MTPLNSSESRRRGYDRHIASGSQEVSPASGKTRGLSGGNDGCHLFGGNIIVNVKESRVTISEKWPVKSW